MDPLDNWREEKRSAWLYRIVSDVESGTVRQVLFLELARAAERQADVWAESLNALPECYVPDLRVRLVAVLVRRFGVRAMRTVLAAMKIRGMTLYDAPDSPAKPVSLPPCSLPEGSPLPSPPPLAGEGANAKGDGFDLRDAGSLREFHVSSHAMPTTLEEVGLRHKFARGGNLRAAVFGVNDGLVSNASLMMGVAGATGISGQMMVFSGAAGLLAGAFSMAAGEYLSVRSQREMYEYQIALEREEVETYPEEEAAELALIFQAKGMEQDAARELADKLIADPDKALDALTREELGLNPETLGSPWGAALFSFVSFALGAAIPLLPFLFASGNGALTTSISLSAAALFGVGAALSLFSGRHALLGGLRMLGIGGAAGAATYLIGKALGVTLG